MQYQINLKKCALIVASTVLLSACQSETSTPSSVKFSPPDRIVQVRAIDLALVRPLVQLGDGTLITMQPGEENTWSGSIRVQPNQSYQLLVNWIETLPQGDLPLARWESTVDVGEDGKDVVVSAELYDYSADFDGDSSTNIEEREDGTDPFDPTNGAGSDTQGNSTGDTGGDTGTTDGAITSGGETGGTTGDITAGSTEGDSAGDTDGETAGDTDGDTDGETAGDTDGETDGVTGGDTDGGTGGDTGGDTGGGTVPASATVLVPRITAGAGPAIDGEDVVVDSAGKLAGEWSGAVEVDNSGSTLWIKNLMIDDGADSDDGAELRRWAAMHDGETLYILVLSDDLNRRESDSIQPWDDDSIEIFIDGDNSKLTAYGDADDFHIILPLQPSNTNASNNEITGRWEFGPMSSQEELDFEFSTGLGNGPDGAIDARFEVDVYEVAIPLDDANITLGLPFGLELQLNDDDDGGLRDSKWGWFHLPFTETDNPDESYTNPSIMGTVVLEE